MNALLMAATALAAAALFALGTYTGIRWHEGQDAIAAQTSEAARKTDALAQIAAADQAATGHSRALASVNQKLGNAREKIALLSGRECFGSDTARVLNAVGAGHLPADPGHAAGAPAAAAPAADQRYTTDRDAAGHIALCRARYAEVASQVNQILDIEAARHPEPKAQP